MISQLRFYKFVSLWIASAMLLCLPFSTRASQLDLPNAPLFSSYTASPIVMLDISRDHQLFYKAYNDYSDLDGDGTLDTTFKNSILYYGYFDPTKCYTYSTGSSKFSPKTGSTGGGTTAPSDCGGDWSGNFLNWVSMSRLDIMRKVLYGGLRISDSTTGTVLQRAAIPTDAHSWVKYYSNTNASDAGYIGKFTPFTTDTSFCNTTYANSGKSQSTSALPVFRTASGSYPNWANNEVLQCTWRSDYSSRVTGGGATPSNNPSMPSSSTSATVEYAVQVDACVSGQIGTENCKSYDGTHYKPIGLLQKYGERAGTTSDYRPRIYFGLMTGSYSKNISGGVLRKAATLPLSNTGDTTKDEINAADGTFTGNNGIIQTISKLRMYGYNYKSGLYFNGGAGSDSCYYQQIGIVSDGSGRFAEGYPANQGNCASWGNPMSEIYIESLRYLAGKTKTSDFSYSSGPDALVGLSDPADWGSGPLSTDNYCSPLNVLMFNASVSSYDSDQAISPFLDLKGSPSLATYTDNVGTGEGIVKGSKVFVGRIGGSAADEGVCTAKSITSLSSVTGICPEAPSLYGSYFMAGAAYFAHTNAIRDRITGANDSSTPYTVKTYAVQMATNVPRITIPGTNVVIQPAYRLEVYNGSTLLGVGTGTIVDFRIVEPLTATSGKFFLSWEDSNQGGDYDMDVQGYISYTVVGTTLTITTQIISQATGNPQGFGYTISGTDKDGVHFHSGIFKFTYSDTASNACASGCDDSNTHWPSTSATYTIGSSGSAALTLKDPMYYAAKWGGFDTSGGATKPNSGSNWDKFNNTTGTTGADGLPDNYFYVTNPGILEASLDRALSGISDTTAGSAAAASSSSLQTSTTIFQGLFTPKSWTGDLLAFTIDSTSAALTQSWSAATQLASKAASNRVIITTGSSTTTDANGKSTTTRRGVAFNWASINDTEKGALGYDSTVTGSDTTAQNRLNYIRGDASNEGTDSGKLRVRSSKLGDIVDSNPVYVGKPVGQYNYADRYLNAYMSSGYSSFRTTNASRTSVVYVGANDGMMHGFNAGNGSEVLAYVPSQVYGAIATLTDQGYNSNHLFSVDGSPEVADAQVPANATATPGDTDWKTVLVSGLRNGGKGIFALDVTNPSATSFAESNASSLVLFEFLDSDDSSGDLGYVYGNPIIAKMANGRWAAIFGNGYNSTSERAVLYIVFLKSSGGSWSADDYVKLTAETGGSNGLGPATGFDIDMNGSVDVVYAGDLKGNLWKFDVSNSDKTQWKVGIGGSPLAIACSASPCSAGNHRPITSAPAVTWHPNNTNTTLVYFGTGRYLTSGDVTAKNTDAMYGVWDNNVATTRDDYQSQTFTTDATSGARTVTNVAINWGKGTGQKMGWVEDFPQTGERQTGAITVLGGTVFYNTFLPNTNLCDCGGTGYLMAVSYLNGGQTSGVFTGQNTNVVGLPIGGVLAGSTILPPGKSGVGVAISNTIKPADPTKPQPATTKLNTGALGGSRISWREVIQK